MTTTITKQQVKRFGPRIIAGYGNHARIVAIARFDDQCDNGHNMFSLTADIRNKKTDLAGGCCHKEIAEAFPELVKYIKWHGCSTDGPLHYVANTIFHAGDRDHNGLREGEQRQIINGKTKTPAWKLMAVDSNGIESEVYKLDKYQDAETEPPAPYTLRYVPWCRVGEGKKRELDAARSCAVWPDATDEELSVSPQELRVKLEARLPVLLEEFHAAMTELGFNW